MGKMSLTHRGDGWEDQDGVFHEGPHQWLFVSILGGCGCGSSETFALEAVRLLREFGMDISARAIKVYDDRFHELMAHWFDSADLIEHGTSIAYPWLTQKGKEVLAAIDAADRTAKGDGDAGRGPVGTGT